MTGAQRVKLMSSWWPDACEAQGWNPQDREKRMEVLSQAVGRFLKSANDLNNTSDIDAVKAYLGMLCGSIKATVETDHAEIGKARQYRWVIRKEILPCLRLYLDDVNGYMREVFHHRADWSDSLERLSPPQVHQALMTLSARLNSLRAAAGHSMHEMNVKAGVKCKGSCKECRAVQYAKLSGPILPPKTEPLPEPQPDDDGDPF